MVYMANDVIKWKTGHEYWLWLFKKFLRGGKIYLQKVILFLCLMRLCFVVFCLSNGYMKSKWFLNSIFFLDLKRCSSRWLKQEESIHVDAQNLETNVWSFMHLQMIIFKDHLKTPRPVLTFIILNVSHQWEIIAPGNYRVIM